MIIPNRNQKEAPPKTVILLAFYIVLSDCGHTVPVSWLAGACRSRTCCRRYLKELKDTVFGDSLYEETEVCLDKLPEGAAETYRSRSVGVAKDFEGSSAFRFDEALSRAKSANEKAHIEKLQRQITVYERLKEYPDFDFYYYESTCLEEDGEDEEYENEPFPDAKDVLAFVGQEYGGKTLRTMQRDLKDIKDAIRLSGRISTEY